MTAAGNLTTRAYESLRRDILSGRIPPDAPLRIGSLASERAVSMSVIREALTRLSEQGLVVASPNQGFRVVPLSREDIIDLADLRITLGTDALRRSIERGAIEWEAAIVSAHHVIASTPMFEEGSHFVRDEWAAAHDRFHESLVAACGRPRLMGVLRTLNDAASIYRSWSTEPTLEVGRDIAAEHRELMELTTSHRADEAATALAAHLSRTAEILLASEARRNTT